MEQQILNNKSIKKAIIDYLKADNYELECKYMSKITKEQFSKTIQYFKSIGLEEKIHDKVLDVLFMYKDKPYRISVSGDNNIKNYCKKNTLELNEIESIMSKRFVKGFSIIRIDDYDFKIDLKDEILITQDTEKLELLVALEKAYKAYRFKQRFSYISQDKIFRYDFTIVKKSKFVDKEFYSHSTFKTSGIISSQDYYEIEIECVKKNIEDNLIFKSMMNKIVECYAVINNLEYPISKSEKNKVINSYLNLWSKYKVTDDIYLKPRQFFIGPQPVTLEQINVIQDGITNTILKDYTVTEKADGERYLFYINEIGNSYLISSKLDVKPIGLIFNNIKNTLIDGEYIKKDIMNNDITLFAAFDVYFYNSKNVLNLPLVNDDKPEESRLGLIKLFYNTFENKLSNDTKLTFIIKEFKYSENIFNDCKLLWNKATNGEYPYNIDGLILTPKYLPVGGLYKKDNPQIIGSWSKVFKWKPPSENTIDFQIKEVKTEKGKNSITVIDSKIYKVYDLYVGYLPIKWESIKAKDYIVNNIRQENKYTLKKFTPYETDNILVGQYYAELNAQGVTLCEKDNSIVDNDLIIEFSYTNDNNLSFPLRWKPLRIRTDKTMPNDFGPAMNVWRSIHNPVTVDIISGNKKIFNSEIPDTEIYYSRNINRDKFASRNMMDFHSYWVKKQFLISSTSKLLENKNKSLMDIACGKAGDLKKWIDSGIDTVFGIDYSRDNIQNPIDGAYSRLIKNNKDNYEIMKNKKYVFLTMDGSKILDKTYIDNMEDKDDKIIAKQLWSLSPSIEGMEKYYGLVDNKFNIVSCMFAIHYFFKTETILDNFIENIDRNLKDGGYFIGACLDGNKIKQILKNIEKNESVQGFKDDRILWNIKKLYNNDDVDKIDYGEEIQIYMESIGREATEYLVDISKLIRKLEKYNIRPVKIVNFEEIYNISLEDKNTSTYYSELLKSLSKEEKDYSFLNMAFIFQKHEHEVYDQNNNIEVEKKIVKKIVKKK